MRPENFSIVGLTARLKDLKNFFFHVSGPKQFIKHVSKMLYWRLTQSESRNRRRRVDWHPVSRDRRPISAWPRWDSWGRQDKKAGRSPPRRCRWSLPIPPSPNWPSGKRWASAQPPLSESALCLWIPRFAGLNLGQVWTGKSASHFSNGPGIRRKDQRPIAGPYYFHSLRMQRMLRQSNRDPEVYGIKSKVNLESWI